MQVFGGLLDLVVEMVDTPGGAPIAPGEEWKADRQGLAKKFVLHLNTIQAIQRGSTLMVSGTPSPVVDHGSIQVLARAVLETFIVFAQVFGGPDMEVSRFRHMTWKLGGLHDRQALRALSARTAAKQAREKSEIDQLAQEVKAHPVFDSLAKGAQKAILKGDWKTGRSWQELAAEAGLSGVYFKQVYGHVCSYSHSSYAAALQVVQAVDLQEQSKLGAAMFGVMCLCMAHFATIYGQLFPSAQAVLERVDSTAYRLWNIEAAQLDAIYAKPLVA